MTALWIFWGAVIAKFLGLSIHGRFFSTSEFTSMCMQGLVFPLLVSHPASEEMSISLACLPPIQDNCPQTVLFTG